MKKDLSIYIHWPWCLKKCPYCDFNSHVAGNDLYEDYINCLISDLEYQKNLTNDRNIVSVFFGGGTPSLMKPDHIRHILEHIDILYGLNNNTEITMECNPTSSTIDKFLGFKAAGINRLSMGIQSFHDSELKFLGREHNSKEAIQTIRNATSTFDNVSFDLIYGLPNQNLQNWSDQLKMAIDFNTQHLSAYQLTVEKNTKFFSEVKKNKWQPLDDDAQADFFEFTRNYMTTHNFNHYEISNFCKDGYDCKHNHNIWQYNDYIGVGAGAHGRYQSIDNNRFLTQNYRMPNTYIDTVKHVKHGFHQHTSLAEHDAWQEMVMMGLRIQKGVPSSLFDGKYSTSQPLEKYFKLGMLHQNGDKIALTSKGQLVLDSILTDIIF